MAIWLTNPSTGAPMAVTYQSLNMNTVTKTEGGVPGTLSGYQILSAGTQMATDYTTEVMQFKDGIELYGMRNVQRVLNLRGMVYGSTWYDLGYKCQVLSAATNPSRIWLRNPTNPFVEIDFFVPTSDLTNFSSGLRGGSYFITPIRMFEPPTGAYMGLSVPFQLSFLMREPVNYGTTQRSQAWTHTGGTNAITAIGDTISNPTITIVTSAASITDYTIANTGTYQGYRFIDFDLSNHGAGTYVLDVGAKSITFNGNIVNDVLVGDSTWWVIEPGSQTLVCDNTPNVTSATVTFYDAWSD